MSQKVERKICSCGRKFETENDFLYHSSRWRRCSEGYLWFNCECDSTLVLLQSDPPWFSPEMSMTPKAAAEYRRFGSFDRVPRMPTAVFQFQAALDDEKASASKLAAAAKQSPFIAASVLSAANGLRASSGVTIASLEHAIAYVGRSVLKTLAVTAAAKTFETPTKVFSSRDFWIESIVTGNIAERLVARFGKGLNADEAYVAGSLANVGKMMMAMLMPEVVDRIVKMQEDPKTVRNWSLLEREHSGASHTTLGEIAAALWGLPENVRDGIVGHHDLQRVLTKGKNGDLPANPLDFVAAAVQVAHLVLLRPLQSSQAITNRFRGRFLKSEAAWESLLDSLYPLVSAAEATFPKA